MKLIDYVKSTENFYYVHGIYTTPTADFLFSSFNVHLDSWLDIYGNCEVLKITFIDFYYGADHDVVVIDNKAIESLG